MATKPLPSQEPEKVTITVRGEDLDINPDPVYVDPGQDVEWVCAEDWVVVFHGKGPFAKRYCHKGDPNSGPAIGISKKKYKYDVFAGEEGHKDPEVIVR